MVTLFRLYTGEGEIIRASGVSYELNSLEYPQDEYTGYSSIFEDSKDQVLSHEIGHNEGAGHEKMKDPQGGIFDYSHAFFYSNSSDNFDYFGTVMSAKTSRTISYFSNPDLTSNIDGGETVVIGVENEADNAQTIRETKLTVSRFRDTAPEDEPIITSFSPISGPPGTEVTISGENFYTTPEMNEVFFGEIAGTVTSASYTELKAVVPEGLTVGQAVPITIATYRGTATSSVGFTVIKKQPNYSINLIHSPDGLEVKKGRTVSFYAYVKNLDTGENVADANLACKLVKPDGTEEALEGSILSDGKVEFSYRVKKKDKTGEYTLNLTALVAATDDTEAWSEGKRIIFHVVKSKKNGTKGKNKKIAILEGKNGVLLLDSAVFSFSQM